MCFGLANVPTKGPALLVGNHTILGLLDPPILYLELHDKLGIFPHALGDHAHFKIPLWRELLARVGVVDGNRESCARLMEEGAHILVFPGGGREVAKRRGEKYRLLWKDRVGFARMAIRHRCPIVPFAAVGAEESYDILVDGDDLMASPFGAIIRALKLREDILMPLVKGIGPTPLPRPERYYFKFARPISTRKYKGAFEDNAACAEVRDRAKAAIERNLAWLLRYREKDPDRELGHRVARSLGRSKP